MLSVVIMVLLIASAEMLIGGEFLVKAYKPNNGKNNVTIEEQHEHHVLSRKDNNKQKPDVGACVLQLDRRSINKFRHDVWYSQANFVYLKLEPEAGVDIVGSKMIVGENIWTWTFYGKEGGLEFLNWPIEFGMWSMDLLSSYVITKPEVMKLKKKSGNCSNLEVGNLETDKIISNALVNVTEELMRFGTMGEKYGPSFFCYKKRIFIEPYYLYSLCKQIVCPVEALKYVCCSYFFNTTTQKRFITCKREKHLEFKYDPFSWILPVIVSVVLFAFSPLFILHGFRITQDKPSESNYGLLINESASESDIQNLDDVIFLDEHFPVTLLQTLCSPVKHCCLGLHSKMSRSFKVHFNRFIRVVIPLFTLLFIALQVCLDYRFLYSFVVTSVNKGVPMGFRSVLAGYEASRKNFLQVLGGPYVAIGLYILVTSVLLVIPSSVSNLLLLGIPSNSYGESYSPLCLKLKHTEQFGSVNIQNGHGYTELYRLLLAKFFMLINIQFWKHAINGQFKRWKMYFCCKLCIILLPFYLLFCVLENLICLILNGLPVMSLGLAVMKSYYLGLRQRFSHMHQNCCTKFLFYLLTPILICSILLFLFMFCTIFLDASLFLTRVAIFTFTGIVVYPKLAYGYIIFSFTVVYYISQSFHDYSLLYQGLLNDTITSCANLQKTKSAKSLIVKRDGSKGVTKDLFEYVIENHFPRRKQVFVSLVKVCIILTILGFSLNILTETYGFRELHTVVHVGTAVFICALPEMVNSIRRNSGQKYKRKRFRKQLQHTIETYIRQRQSPSVVRKTCETVHSKDSSASYICL